MIFTADQIPLSWRIKGLGSVVHVCEKRNANKVLLGEGGGRLLESPTRKWEDNIKRNLKELECEVVGWIYYGL